MIEFFINGASSLFLATPLSSSLIAGLVKDYVRELPEPLFTKAMFDMMVDGLSVCLPDDPNGNSKLMFSIIECLSEINAVSRIYWSICVFY